MDQKQFKINCFVSKLINYWEESVLCLKEKRHKQVSVVEEWNQIILQNDKMKYSEREWNHQIKLYSHKLRALMFYVAVNFIIGNRIAQRIIAPLSWFHYIKVIMAFLLYILQFPCKENLDIKPDWLDVWLAIFANDDMVWGDKSERKCPH